MFKKGEIVGTRGRKHMAISDPNDIHIVNVKLNYDTDHKLVELMTFYELSVHELFATMIDQHHKQLKKSKRKLLEAKRAELLKQLESIDSQLEN